MSWKLNAAEKMIITTGDGKEYRPLYVNTVKTFEYNVASFNFPNVRGTLVNRSERQGSSLTLRIIFQGADHLETAEQFEQSADNKRPWTIQHPMHGVLTMQPSKITIDNTKYNTTEITADLLETITRDAPIVGVDPVNQVQINAENLDSTAVEDLSATASLEASDTVLLGALLDSAYTDAEVIIENDLDLQDYFNLYQVASAAILNATAEPLAAMQAVRAMLTAPGLFAQTVKARLNMLQQQLEELEDRIYNTVNQKKIYEFYGNSIVATMALTTTYPLNNLDFQNATDVLEIIDQINDNYDSYLNFIETLQTDTNDGTESYIPGQAAMSGLQLQLSYCVANLLDIALGAQQERQVILEKDSNIITLAHRFYGLQSDDSTIDQFIKTNSIGLNEKLQIKKGRLIKYYI